MKRVEILKTLIISAFPGCGKSFLAKYYKNSKFTFLDKYNDYLNCKYEFKAYINEITSLTSKSDFLLISQYPEVLNILHEYGTLYIIVVPNNS